jgi:hypothetical protein
MIEIQRENIKSGAPDLIISGNIMDMQIRVKTECFLLNLEDWMGWKTGGWVGRGGKSGSKQTAAG